MTTISPRIVPSAAESLLCQQGYTALEARLYAARGIHSRSELEHELAHLLPFHGLKNITEAGKRLADAIAAKERILIVADYDADGATACAVGMRGLAMLGAVVDFVVPNRFEYGYGLTPEIVELAAQKSPDLIVTVDNGIASVAGVAAAHTPGLHRWISNIWAEPSKGGATGRAYGFRLALKGEPGAAENQLREMVVYEDQLVKTAQGWRIKERRVTSTLAPVAAASPGA